jgi:hypothetical protein
VYAIICSFVSTNCARPQTGASNTATKAHDLFDIVIVVSSSPTERIPHRRPRRSQRPLPPLRPCG